MKINDAQKLLNAVYIDWSHLLANPQGLRKGSQITWDNYKPKLLPKIVMMSDVIDLFNEKQFTFQLIEDGSLIQLYYQYDEKGNNLLSARLAFYSTVTNGKKGILEESNSYVLNREEARAIEGDFFESTSVDEYQSDVLSMIDSPVNWLRIDYDPINSKGVLHHDCHMHLSAFPDARLVVAGVPTPRQFIEFIVALCYPQLYKKHRLNDDGQYANKEYLTVVNATSVPQKEHYIFQQITHFRVPIS